MTESRMPELAKELLARSTARKVEWEGTRSEDAYRVFFPDVVIRISRTSRYIAEGEYAEVHYRLDLTGDTRRVIGSLEPAQEDPMHEVLAELFKLAEQYVLQNVQESGIDKALDYLKRN